MPGEARRDEGEAGKLKPGREGLAAPVPGNFSIRIAWYTGISILYLYFIYKSKSKAQLEHELGFRHHFLSGAAPEMKRQGCFGDNHPPAPRHGFGVP